MPSRTITERLRVGEVLLMDGATGSELQRRGVNVSKGAAPESMGAWSGTANIDAPAIVRQVHEDYLTLGVDLITSNNFWTSRARLALAGLADQWETYTRAGAELAIQARNAVNPEAFVAGGVAPPGSGDLRAEFIDQARIMAEVGVDLLLAEWVGTIADCVVAVEALAAAGLPVFLGVRNITLEGTMQYGECLEDLVTALEGRPVDAILLMCSRPEAISAGLPRLRQAFAGPIGAYANIGYGPNPKFGTVTGEQWFAIDQETYPPELYASFAREWLAMGAQIVGGCCATGPSHISAIQPIVKGTLRKAGHG